MRSHSLWPTAPLNTRRSVPRLMPLNSVRTRAWPGPGGDSGAARSSATPFLAYQRDLATRLLPTDRRVIMLQPRPSIAAGSAVLWTLSRPSCSFTLHSACRRESAKFAGLDRNRNVRLPASGKLRGLHERYGEHLFAADHAVGGHEPYDTNRVAVHRRTDPAPAHRVRAQHRHLFGHALGGCPHPGQRRLDGGRCHPVRVLRCSARRGRCWASGTR